MSEAVDKEGTEEGSTGEFRSGFVPLVGRPNVGKSTLLNRLIGYKVAIVSPVPQTTRNRIRGVLTLPGRGQVVFIDTPGIHKPKFRMNRRMVNLALEALPDTDVILFMVDASEKMGGGDRFVMQQLREAGTPTFLLLNKIDRVRKNALLPIIDAYSREMEFAEIIPISAADGTQCDRLVDVLLQHLPVGPAYFPEDYLTDQLQRFLAGEIVREKLLYHTRQELPHATAVRVESYKEDGPLLRIQATILVERENQKAIVIGKQGGLLKIIGTEARLELEEQLETKVFLELWVRVEPSWRKSDRLLDELGICRS
jgi:GTP-binding protein Era